MKNSLPKCETISNLSIVNIASSEEAETETQGSDVSKSIPAFLELLDDTQRFKKRNVAKDSSSSEMSDQEEKEDLIIGVDDNSISDFKLNKFNRSQFIDRTKQ